MTESDPAATPTDTETASTPPVGTARERILRAAAEEFSEHGFSGARINRIADAAGQNKQLIYHYFDSKEGIYAAVLDEMLSSMRSATDVTSGIREIIHGNATSTGKERRAWGRMAAWEGLSGERPVTSAAQRQESIQRQIQTFMRMQQEGRFATDIDPRFALATIYAVATARYSVPQLVDFCLGQGAADSDDTMAAWADMIVRMFALRG
jgi:AcrR family transcriptional regulator